MLDEKPKSEDDTEEETEDGKGVILYDPMYPEMAIGVGMETREDILRRLRGRKW